MPWGLMLFIEHVHCFCTLRQQHLGHNNNYMGPASEETVIHHQIPHRETEPTPATHTHCTRPDTTQRQSPGLLHTHCTRPDTTQRDRAQACYTHTLYQTRYHTETEPWPATHTHTVPDQIPHRDRALACYTHTLYQTRYHTERQSPGLLHTHTLYYGYGNVIATNTVVINLINII